MTYTILCSIIWIVAGLFNLLAMLKDDDIWIVISTGIFLLGCAIFIGLFGAVMVQINIYNKEVLGKECSAVKSHLRRSGDEFTAWSALSFIFISAAVSFNIMALCSSWL